MKRRYDLPILFLTITLVLFGLAMVYSASAFIAAEAHNGALAKLAVDLGECCF
jgi:cell division protein FtsW (lipid II flippase)